MEKMNAKAVEPAHVLSKHYTNTHSYELNCHGLNNKQLQGNDRDKLSTSLHPPLAT